MAWLADRDVARTLSDLAGLFALELNDELALDQLRQRAAVDEPGQVSTAKEPDPVTAAVVRPVELLALRAIPPLDVLGLDVTRRLVKSLAALAIPDSLRRQRWVPAIPGGQHADR